MSSFAYEVGQEITFEPTEPNTSIKKARVLKKHSIGPNRRSQIILLAIKEDRSHLKLVAKCYDPTRFPEHQVHGPSKDAYCAELKCREARAYRKLVPLYSLVVPSFHGEYQYVAGEVSQMSRMNAILLQFIDHPTLSDLSSRDIDRDCLKRETFQSLRRCHELGVYHRDIGPSNIFFTGQKAIICDWENATFADDPSEEDPKNWRKSDEDSLISTLKPFDIKDSRPLPPPDFFGWNH